VPAAAARSERRERRGYLRVGRAIITAEPTSPTAQLGHGPTLVAPARRLAQHHGAGGGSLALDMSRSAELAARQNQLMTYFRDMRVSWHCSKV
jgi:hypothetical protein